MVNNPKSFLEIILSCETKICTNGDIVFIFLIDEQGVWYHSTNEGENLTIAHASDKTWTFCRLNGPFAKDNLGQLHISFPKDPRHPDLTRYETVRTKLIMQPLFNLIWYSNVDIKCFILVPMIEELDYKKRMTALVSWW